MRVAVLNYGVGNYRALISSLREVGVEAVEVNRPKEVYNFGCTILPGVGSFDGAVVRLRRAGFDAALLELKEKGDRVIGVCVGMQLLFDKSDEGPEPGLGLIRGRVRNLKSIASPNINLPVHGWFPTTDVNSDVRGNRALYFSHSFGVEGKHSATSQLYTPVPEGKPVAASVKLGNLIGLQFHPERSGVNGLLALSSAIQAR